MFKTPHVIAFFILALTPCLSAQGGPPPGYTWTENPSNGHFYAMTGVLTWSQAKAEVDALPTVELVTIRNQAENDWLYNAFSRDLPSSPVVAFIGFTDEAQEGVWSWRSGESVLYDNWVSGQPNDASGGEDAGTINIDSSGGTHAKEWDDAGPPGNAGWSAVAIIEFFGIDTDEDGLFDDDELLNHGTDPLDQDTDDDGLSDGEEVDSLRADTRWIQGPSGNFYRLAPASAWSQARASAIAQGHDLTSVQDQAEADWLYSTFGNINNGFWIGLSDFSGIFEWSDGSPVNYTQWATGEPSTTFVAAFVGGPSSSEPGNWYGEFAGVIPRLAVWESPGPNAPQTSLDPLVWDIDGDGLSDGQEDGIDVIYWDGFGLPGVTGTDPLVFVADADPLTTTNPLDTDSDEDGIADGVEDADGDGATTGSETNPALADTDGDTLPDGLELGLTSATLDTDGNVFVPDADPLTTTNPLVMDTDSGGVHDGIEDQNKNGAIDTWETDPNQSFDDDFAFYVSDLIPGERIKFDVHNANPSTWVFPVYSIRGAGPTSLSIGVTVDLSAPMTALNPGLSNQAGRTSFYGPTLPINAPIGFSVYWQGVEVPFGAQAPRVSNSILLPVGSN